MDNGITFDANSERRFQKAMTDTYDLTQRSAAETVKYAAIRFAMSGRAASKVGKKNRDVIDSPQKGAKWMIVVRGQKKSTLVPTNTKRDPRRVIKMRGAAKNSWAGVFRQLNGKPQALSGGGRGASWGTAKKKGMKGETPTITIFNYTSYIMKAFPALVPEAYKKAANAMQAILDRKVKRELEAKWN